MVPVRAFSFNNRVSSSVSWPSSVGITPVRGAFRAKSRDFRFVREPKSTGMVPEKKQARALKCSRFVSNASSGGRGPKSKVESNAMFLSVNMVKSSNGIDPLNALFPDKCSVSVAAIEQWVRRQLIAVSYCISYLT